MIKVDLRNNASVQTVIVNETRTLRSVLEEQEFDYTRGGIFLDGATLRPGDLDKSFADLGITEKCYLLQVLKTDNA